MHERLTKSDEEILEERQLEKIKERVCIAESNLLKTIEFKLVFENPYTYIEVLYRNYFSENKSENKDIYF